MSSAVIPSRKLQGAGHASSLEWGGQLPLSLGYVFSHVWLFVISWTVAHQCPLSLRLSQQEYWSGLPFPPPGDLPNPRIKTASLASPTLAGGFLPLSHLWSPLAPRTATWSLVIAYGRARKITQRILAWSWTPQIQPGDLSCKDESTLEAEGSDIPLKLKCTRLTDRVCKTRGYISDIPRQLYLMDGILISRNWKSYWRVHTSLKGDIKQSFLHGDCVLEEGHLLFSSVCFPEGEYSLIFNVYSLFGAS